MGEEWEGLRRDLVKEVAEAAEKTGGIEKEAFRMAAGHGNFGLVKDLELQRRLRNLIALHLGIGGGDLGVAEGQPFHLGLIRRSLEKAGDVDYEFLRQAEEGFAVGGD